MIEHTLTTTSKALAADILHRLRFDKGLTPHLARDGGRYVIRYRMPA